jgi:streptogramin lyase
VQRLARSAFVLAVTLVLTCSTAPATAAPTIKEFPIPTKDLGPSGITPGPDGNLWFATAAKQGVGRSTPTGTISAFKPGFSGPSQEIVTGADGNLWFTEPNDDKIGRITTLGTVTEYSAKREPSGITAGSDGNLWFTESADPGAIGRINPSTGKVTEFSVGLTPNSKPLGITAGPDGALWFTQSTNPGAIGRITTTGTITEYRTGLTANSKPPKITAGPDGALWFTESTNPGAIGRITTTGTITEYRTGLTANSQPSGITAADDGNLYFTEAASPGRIGTITPAGLISELTTPTNNSAPNSITTGPDGNLWFTEVGNHGQIATMTVAPAVTSAAVTSLTEQGATLNAEVAPNSQSTTYRFEYGPTTAYGSQTSPASAGAGAGASPVSTPVTGLTAGSVYHFRAVASNATGTTYGPDSTFTTHTPPLATLAPLGTTGSSTGVLSPMLHRSPPALGRTAVADVLSGRVTVRTPGSAALQPLAAADNIPMGSVVDTEHGVVLLTTAVDRLAHVQSATLWGGTFVIGQTVARHGMTTFTLAGPLSCPGRARRASLLAAATQASSRKPSRSLWAKDNHGHFSTRGQNSVATVRGTYWETVDRCNGTLTVVKKGAVSVRDLRRRRTVLVKAGHSYLARA